MDNETIKILILEKIFNVFVPKIIGYKIFLDGMANSYVWTPNFSFIQNNNIIEKIQQIYIQTNINCDIQNITLQKRDNILFDELIDLEFKNKKIAITEICKNVDIEYLIKIGMCAINEINYYENPENLLIGSIKKILEINPDIDLANLNTRRVLLEKIN